MQLKAHKEGEEHRRYKARVAVRLFFSQIRRGLAVMGERRYLRQAQEAVVGGARGGSGGRRPLV